jgi:hypothetical protein
MSCPLGMHFYPDHVYAYVEGNTTAGWNEVNGKSSVHARRMFIELSHFPASPDYQVARTMNEYESLSQRVEACYLPPSILSVDYWSVGNVVEFAQRRNKGMISQECNQSSCTSLNATKS